MKKASVLIVAALLAEAGCAKNVPSKQDEIAVHQVIDNICKAQFVKDVNMIMAGYSPDTYVFDLAPPHRYTYDMLKDANTQFYAAFADNAPITCAFKDLTVKVDDDLAYARFILAFSVRMKTGELIDIDLRGTEVLEKRDDKWLVVHEHLSLPVQPFTMQAQAKDAVPEVQGQAKPDSVWSGDKK